MNQPYDSTKDTTDHIARVNDLLLQCQLELKMRGEKHDASKLQPPEKEGFDNASVLRHLVYGSDGYKEALANLRETLFHHYASNSHHPEHYHNGIVGMDLFDIMEMLMDWKAASERHETGSIEDSLNVNEKRFNIHPQLLQILRNTCYSMGWVKNTRVVL